MKSTEVIAVWLLPRFFLWLNKFSRCGAVRGLTQAVHGLDKRGAL